MASRAGMRLLTLAALLVVAACGTTSSTACRCPKPVAYDEPTLKKISEALRALPAENVLRLVQEQDRDLLGCPVADVLRSGRVLRFGGRPALVTRGGSEVPIDGSAARVPMASIISMANDTTAPNELWYSPNSTNGH